MNPCAIGICPQHLGQRSLHPPSDTVVQHCKVDLLVDATTALWSVFWAFKAEQLEKYVDNLLWFYVTAG